MKKREDKKEKVRQWQKKMESDFLKFNYQEVVEKNGPLSYEMWKFLGQLIKRHSQKYKKIGKQFLPVN
jgi:hypothetical protein